VSESFFKNAGPRQPGSHSVEVPQTTEEKLSQEVEDLKRQLEEQKGLVRGSSHAALARPWRPSSVTIWSIFLGAAVLLAVAFFAGYVPLQKRQTLIQGEAQEQAQALPRIEVIEVGRSSGQSELQLPGSIQAVTEAPILARADGYIQRRMVDIGDRVQAGQTLAEIDAPELDEQLRQAKASVQQTQAALQQAQAALEQALANFEQGKTNLELARVTAQRWSALAEQGIVSRQDNDQYQAQYQSQTAGVQALEKAIAAQRGNVAAAQANVAAAEANLARLDDMQKYRVVKAPFEGVVTLRNVDVGALVNTGNTLLFRIAQTGTLRTYINVPQTNASSVRVGQSARLSVTNLPGRSFIGTVARTANSLDPASRTMLVEVQVPNPSGALLPGMYAQVDLSNTRTNPPLLVPGDALIVRADGTQVAVVGPDNTVHLQKIQLGRDYGDRLEILSGLQPGDRIVANPGDSAREGVKINPVAVAEKEFGQTPPKGAGK
jgi:multidrug efflux pump subunit AcrA (membrane-fusion protein)